MDLMGKSMGEVLELPDEELFVTRLAAAHRSREQESKTKSKMPSAGTRP